MDSVQKFESRLARWALFLGGFLWIAGGIGLSIHREATDGGLITLVIAGIFACPFGLWAILRARRG